MQDELVERAKGGDHDAFTALVRPQLDRLYGLTGLLLRDPSRAEDALQEALLRAWRDLGTLREVDRFGAWLRRLVVNAAYDEGRRLGRRLEIELAGLETLVVGNEFDALLDRDELIRGFRRLKDEERTVLALRYYLELSSADAAATLGMREVTYRSKVHRALQALRAALAAEARTAARPEGRWT